MNPRIYLFRFIIGIGILLTLIAFFNRIIDPFNFYRDIEIQGVNKIKTKAARFERYIKPQILVRERPEAIILGSSFSEIGLSPLNASFTRQSELHGYNFAFAGSNWADMQCLLKYALKNAPISRIVMGLHPGPLPRANCKDRFPEIDSFSQTLLLLSFRALKASVSTVRNQHRQPNHTREGMYFYRRGEPGTDVRFHKFFKKKLLKIQREKQCNLDALSETPPHPLELTTDLPEANTELDLSGLRDMIRLAKENEIELRIYVYPSHAQWLELDVLCDTYIDDWSALGAIVELVDKEGGDTEVWEFYSYNKYTGESVMDIEPVYWQDPRHYNFEYGDLLLNAMFGKKNSATMVGYQVNSANLKKVYGEYKNERSSFIVSNPEFLLELKALLQRNFVTNPRYR